MSLLILLPLPSLLACDYYPPPVFRALYLPKGCAQNQTTQLANRVHSDVHGHRWIAILNTTAHKGSQVVQVEELALKRLA